MTTPDDAFRGRDSQADDDPGASKERSPEEVVSGVNINATLASDTTVHDLMQGRIGVVEMTEEYMLEVANSSDRDDLELISDVLINVANPQVLALVMRNPAVSDDTKALMVWDNERVPVDVLVEVARETRNPFMIYALCASRKKDLGVVRALLANPYLDEIENHGEEKARLAREKTELIALDVGSDEDFAELEILLESVSSGSTIAALRRTCEQVGGHFVFTGTDHPIFSLEGDVLYMDVFGVRVTLEIDAIAGILSAELQRGVFRNDPANLKRIVPVMRAIEDKIDRF